MSRNSDIILEAAGISKSYGGVKALSDVSFSLYRGEVHAVIGENGAGKTTLMNILGGIVKPDKGILLLNGSQVEFGSPQEACEKGIATIHQELTMLPHMNVMENIYMGHLNKFNITSKGFINRKLLSTLARETLDLLNFKIDPEARVNDLSISERQGLEIAKALSGNPEILIMDEPNSSLTGSETEQLFEVIGKLTARGVSIVYVSHKIDEVLRIADRITVLRDGLCSGLVEKSDTTVSDLFSMIAGRDLKDIRKWESNKSDKTLLTINGLSGKRFQGVSFDLFKGEVLGLYGLVGSGRSELARAIFGADKISSGSITFNGKQFRPVSPESSLACGLAMVPEDRKELGLFSQLSVLTNMTISNLPEISRLNFLISPSSENDIINKYAGLLKIKFSKPEQPISSLSGGNQQKVILARNILTRPGLLILDEPTHGVDVGAKNEIHQIIETLTSNGMGIIYISSEMNELMSVSDRVAVMHEGKLAGILTRNELSEKKLIAYATGFAMEVTEC